MMNQTRIINLTSFVITLLLLFLISNPGLASDNNWAKSEFTFSVPTSLDPLKLSTENIEIQSSWNNPSIVDNKTKAENWKHINRSTTLKTLAGVSGEVLIDIFQTENLQLTREVWYSFDKTEIAIRQKITNRSENPIYLEKLIPFVLSGPKGLVFNQDSRVEDWRVLIQKRLKNGKPASIKPENSDPVEIDPFCVFSATIENTPDLLIGYLSQKGHLAHLSLQFEDDNNGLKFSSLGAICQFDGCLIPAGGERTSQWVYISAGYKPNELISRVAD
jgi:hypothetical protein